MSGAPEAASNDVNELLDNPEATEADVVSSVNDPTQPQHELNACFAKEMRIELDFDKTSEELNGNQVYINEVVEVVTEKGEDQKPASKSDQDVKEKDDVEVFDVKNEKFNLSDEEAIVKVNEDDTDEDVQGYDEISVSRKDDQCNNEVNEDSLDEFEDPAVGVGDNFKVILEDPNEFIEAEVERNVVKLLFEGTFKENSEEILENLSKFPEQEVEFKDVTSDEADVSNPENPLESSTVKTQLDDLDNNLDKSEENIFEDDAKNTKNDNDTRAAVAENVVSVCIEKPLVDGTNVQEPEPDAKAVIAEDIPSELKTNVKAEREEDGNPASSSQKTITKSEKLIHIWKFVTVTDYAAIVMDKHGFDKDHNCVVAEFPVIITVIKPTNMPVNYSQLMNDKTGLDILSFPWKPGDVLNWFCHQALMYVLVLVHKLLCLLKAYCMVTTTVAYSKYLMKAELLEVELLDAEPSLFLLNTTKLDEEENVQDNMKEDQTASADNFMVADLAQSGRGIFSR